MTKEEITRILRYLKIQYPHSFDHLKTDDEANMYVAIWNDAFKDEEARLVQAAVKKLCYNNTSGFAPTIGQIREEMLELTGIRLMEAETVWNTARKFWKNLGTRIPSEIEPRYKELPDEVKVMFSIDDMIHYADMNTADVIQYEKPRFMKEYRNIEAQKKANMLTGSISKAALTYTGHLMIGDKDEHK